MSDAASLLITVLHASHVDAGARMVPFGGYDMPVQYPLGVLAEHRWTREHAGAFDVSHMGPAFLTLTQRTGDGDADHKAVAALIEPLICGDIAGLKPGQIRYTLLLNATGGMIDDLMVARPAEPEHQGSLYIVVNAGTKDNDFALIAAAAGDKAVLARADDGALIALQGPEAHAAMAGIVPEASALTFMTHRRIVWQGVELVVARSGYTGEDGYEVLVPASAGAAFWAALLADQRVHAIGLGARDSLRLEAGLPLYGHDADESVSPVEASLNFALSKRRREAADFPGAARILAELKGAASRVRVGLKVLEGAPAREGAEIADESGAVIGRVTSGGPSPSLGYPIAMGFVPPAQSAVGTRLKVIVRGKAASAEVVPMPFFPHRYVRKV
jgi:aminomethyltransferase